VFTNVCEISRLSRVEHTRTQYKHVSIIDGRTLQTQYQHISKNYKYSCNIKLKILITVINNKEYQLKINKLFII